MRLSMKSNNLPSMASPHVQTQQHCNISTLTQQLTFQAQQSLHHHSLRNFESLSLDPVQPVMAPQQPDSVSRLADRWEEFMGVRDWAGLLEPLDENLSHEILRYGNFIEAAYRAFDFDPGSPSYGSSKYNKKSLLKNCGLPNSGYRLTRHLRATSGIKVPEWASSSWAALQSSWIGYVAVSNNKAVINRLGRREVVIALRGTATCLEWLENLRATLDPVPIPGSIENLKNGNVGPWDQDGPPMVESGFLSLYTSGTDMWPSLQDAIRMEVSQILKEYNKDEPLSITITGHSLGAALAKIAAYDIKTTFEKAPLVTVISFGGPRVGNQSFRSLIDRQGTKILRVVNPSDLITKVPGFVIDNNENFVDKHKKPSKKHIKNCHNKINSNSSSSSSSSIGSKKLQPLAGLIPKWVQPFRVEDKKSWWVYAEVGRELRLENKETEQLPYYLSNMNVAKCHDLKTYLTLVENCPVKAFVKRSLNKLSHRYKHKNEKNNAVAA